MRSAGFSALSASSKVEARAALDLVQSKAPQVQQVVGEAAVALCALSGTSGNSFGDNIVAGLTKAIDNAKEGNTAPFDELYEMLSGGVEEMVGANPANSGLKQVQRAAAVIIALLREGVAPGESQEEFSRRLAEAFAQLESLTAVPAQDATEDQRLAAALAATLYNALSVAAEGDMLGDIMNKLLEDLKNSPLLSPFLRFLGMAFDYKTSEAVLGLSILLAHKIEQEADLRRDAMEEDSLELTRLAQLREAIQNASIAADNKGEDDLQTVRYLSSSAVTTALAQCSEEAMALINKLILQGRVKYMPRDLA
jgi:hypothetical protein